MCIASRAARFQLHGKRGPIQSTSLCSTPKLHSSHQKPFSPSSAFLTVAVRSSRGTEEIRFVISFVAAGWRLRISVSWDAAVKVSSTIVTENLVAFAEY
ncbi:hypothetical protein Taro_031147 [Colocasia esculenta]|uniref:Uncharacterized protein n=1 Tax=Colocasia esculenta TaxID=4460 RepID=A0A843VPA1_COLES|nr:hypothetical protein [Colocasia esculenta]